jgi:hypothetical protein
VKRKYGGEPWFKSVRGNLTQYLLAESPEAVRKEFPRLLEGIPARVVHSLHHHQVHPTTGITWQR